TRSQVVMHGFCSILPVYLALNSRSRDRNPGHVKCDRYIQQALVTYDRSFPANCQQFGCKV
ncbi:hypothetical protein, partial [Microcoleus sp. CAWBG640]|uniref:hypothetical protein n=1 Tax=Microcoleus sp. CAWBG640 TaxID=2841653 RepID=UPI00312B76A0